MFFVIVYSLCLRITRYVLKTTLKTAKANLIPSCVKGTLICKSNPCVLTATLMTSYVSKAKSHPSHPILTSAASWKRFQAVLYNLHTWHSRKPANPTALTRSPHSKSRYESYTPDTTDSPGTSAYSSSLSTRLCHHASVRCSRRVHDTAVLSHPRAQRGVTVASCGSRRDRPSASRARM